MRSGAAGGEATAARPPAVVAALVRRAARLKSSVVARPLKGGTALRRTRRYLEFMERLEEQEVEAAAHREMAAADAAQRQLLALTCSYDLSGYRDDSATRELPGPLRLIYDFYATLYEPKKQLGAWASTPHDDARAHQRATRNAQHATRNTH